MLKFTVKNPEDWTQEQFEEFFQKYFKHPDYTLEECWDTWDGNDDFDANVYQDEEEGTYHCTVYRCVIKNGCLTTDTGDVVAHCDLDIEEI